MMVAVSKMQADDVEKSYDFLTGGKFLEPTGKVSRAKLGALVGALQQLGDIPAGLRYRTPDPAGRDAVVRLT